jgi:hypothetical protein
MSAKTPKHYGSLIDGRLRAQSLHAVLKTEPEGTVWEFTAKKEKINKTRDQNSFLHVLLQFIADKMNEAGLGDGRKYTKERIKAYCKQAGLYPMEDFVKPGGEVVQVNIDTRDLTKEQAGALIESMNAHFAEEFHMILPEPQKQQAMAFEKVSANG